MRCYLKQRGRNGLWYIWRYDELTGQCSKRSTHTRDHDEAQKQLAKFILEDPAKQRFKSALLSTVLIRYYQLHGQHCFGAGTVRLVMKRLVDLEADMPVCEFTAAAQERFVAGLVPGTAKRYLAQVFAALNWAHNREEIDAPPRKVKISGEAGEGVAPLKLEQLRALCEAATTKRQRLFLAIAICTAQRPAHILELTWDRVRFDTGVIDFQDPARKRTKKVRPVVPMCATLQAFLIEQKSIGPVLQRHGRRLSGHRMLFRRLAKAAKVTGSAYGIRKATATYLRRKGVPEMDLMAMLGHRLKGVTERYAHADPQFMTAARDAAEALIRDVDAGWLRRFTCQSLATGERKYGAGKGARTLDLNLGNEAVIEHFHARKAANDD